MFLNLYFHSKVFFSWQTWVMQQCRRNFFTEHVTLPHTPTSHFYIHPSLVFSLPFSILFFFLTFFPFTSKFIGRTYYYSPISLMAFKATKITSDPLQIKTHSNINKTTEKTPFTNNLILSNVNILPHSLKKSIEN